MRGFIPALLAIVVGFVVLTLVWKLLNRDARGRRIPLKDGAIDRTAADLIEQHGDGAAGEADRLAAERLAVGDIEGDAIWKLVGKAIAKQQTG